MASNLVHPKWYQASQPSWATQLLSTWRLLHAVHTSSSSDCIWIRKWSWLSSYLAISSVFWDCKAFGHRGSVSNISLVSHLCKGITEGLVFATANLACTTNYSVMINVLCFCDDAQLTQTFCMHVFTEGCTSVSIRYKVVQFIPCFVIVCWMQVFRFTPLYPNWLYIRLSYTGLVLE